MARRAFLRPRPRGIEPPAITAAPSAIVVPFVVPVEDPPEIRTTTSGNPIQDVRDVIAFPDTPDTVTTTLGNPILAVRFVDNHGMHVTSAGVPVTGAYAVDTLADLKILEARPAVVFTLGYATIGDGGGGPPFLWVGGSVLPADDFMVVAGAGPVPGRWVRSHQAGAAVSPKWGGAGLPGSTDDTVRFQVVVNYGAAVDISGCTIPLALPRIEVSTGDAPSIFSDGSGKFTLAAGGGTLDSSMLISVTRSDFKLDNVVFELPSTASPAAAPNVYCGILFSNVDRARVTRCRFAGGVVGIYFAHTTGGTDFVVDGCSFTGQFREGLNSVGFKSAVVTNNNFYDGGLDSVAGSAGAIRLGNSGSLIPGENIIVTGNTIVRWNPLIAQEAIDCFAASMRNVLIGNNIIDSCGGGGIELKTSGNVGTPDVYQNWIISDNIINLLATGGSGIALNTTGPGTPPSGKSGNMKISGNYIRVPGGGTPGNGMAITAWTGVEVTDNRIEGTDHGIWITPSGTAALTATNIDISNNRIDSINTCIETGGGRFEVNMRVMNNRLISANSYALLMNTDLATNAVIRGNWIETLNATNQHAAGFRNMSGGIVEDNTFKTGAYYGLYLNSPGCLNTVFRANHFISGTGNAALRFDFGTGVLFIDNFCNIPGNVNVACIYNPTAAAGITGVNFRRVPQATIPTGGGSLGDVVPNSTPTAGGVSHWICTTAGVSGVAVWKPVAIGA